MRNFLLLIVILSSHFLIAQNSIISGKVIDNKKRPVVGAVVHCIEINEKYRKFSITDNQGEWSINKIDSGVYTLDVRHVGYESLRMIFSSDTVTKLSIKLTEQSITLGELVVNAYKNAIVQSGDTTIYDIKKFTSGFEYNLNEILEKLPGISTSSEGDIFYNGIRIGQILVEGKDVVGNQHKLTGELFLVEDIDAIHIIDNYKNYGEKLSFNKSKNVALDIKLTENALNEWHGRLESSAGYESKGKASTDIFNISNTLSTTLFGRLNNSANQILSLADFLSLQPSQKRAVGEIVSQNNLNSFFSLPNSLISNHDGLAAGNLLIESNEKHRTKVILMYTSLDRKSEKEFIRTYYNSDSLVYSGNSNESQKTNLMKPTINHLWSPSDQITLELEIPFSSIRSSQIRNDNGRIGQLNTLNRNQFNESNLDILPMVIFNYRLNDNWYFKVGMNHYSREKNEILNISDVNNLFNTAFNSLNFRIDENDLRSSVYGEMQHSLKDSSLILLKMSYQHEKINTNSTSDLAEEFSWDFSSSRSTSEILAGYSIQNKNYSIDSELVGQYLQTNSNEFNTIQTLYDFKIEVIKHFDVKTDLSLTFNTKKDPIKLYQLNDEVRVLSNLESSSSELSPTNIVTKNELKISFVHLNFASSSQLFVTSTVNRIMNSPLLETIFLDNYFVTNWTKSHHEDNLNLYTIYNSPLLLRRIRASVKLFSGVNRIETILGSKIYVNQHRASLDVRTSLKGKFNYTIGISKQIGSNRTSNSRFEVDNINFQQLFDYKKIHLDYLISFRTLSVASRRQNRIWGINLNGRYQFGEKLKITLEGRDLLNLNGAIANQSTFQVNYFEENNFVRFPGYILAGIIYNFL